MNDDKVYTLVFLRSKLITNFISQTNIHIFMREIRVYFDDKVFEYIEKQKQKAGKTWNAYFLEGKVPENMIPKPRRGRKKK
ncbi:MAG: hypothetical protein ACOC80_09850 [Petrotogales bacterium]